MINCFSQNCGENKHEIYVQKYFPENRAIYEFTVEKYGRARDDTDDNIRNTAYAYCMLDY
jgi:hypothetical protein